jgi:hypothetical protein
MSPSRRRVSGRATAAMAVDTEPHITDAVDGLGRPGAHGLSAGAIVVP